MTRCQFYLRFNCQKNTVLEGDKNIVPHFVKSPGELYPLPKVLSRAPNACLFYMPCIISPDGQRHIQLLSNKDGIVTPMVLDYERSTNRLLVVNRSDITFLYDVSRGKYNHNTT